VPVLQARGYRVRVMVRAASPEYKEIWPEAEIAVADALDLESLKKAMEDVDTAYYLIHSLLLGPRDFASTEIMAALNFRRAAEHRKVRRIIYLGGLGDTRANLSPHLKSRIMVAEELKNGKVPVTILRAAIIIGSGSASYEIIHHLINNFYMLPIPRWAKNKCQPIGIRERYSDLSSDAENAFRTTQQEKYIFLISLFLYQGLFLPGKPVHPGARPDNKMSD
jgi:uncharacterized protein YbjT (DUF2867 family)